MAENFHSTKSFVSPNDGYCKKKIPASPTGTNPTNKNSVACTMSNIDSLHNLTMNTNAHNNSLLPVGSELSEIEQKYIDEYQKTINRKELTVRSIVIGLFFGCLLCFSNTYFALQTGWATMGSLQSALVGYGILLLCEKYSKDKESSKSTLYELNIIQTVSVSSATMPVAAGLVSIIPALTMLDDVSSFDAIKLTWIELILWTFSLAIFGTFMAVPLRKQMIINQRLPFPSGTATAKMIQLFYSNHGGGGGGGNYDSNQSNSSYSNSNHTQNILEQTNSNLMDSHRYRQNSFCDFVERRASMSGTSIDKNHQKNHGLNDNDSKNDDTTGVAMEMADISKDDTSTQHQVHPVIGHNTNDISKPWNEIEYEYFNQFLATMSEIRCQRAKTEEKKMKDNIGDEEIVMESGETSSLNLAKQWKCFGYSFSVASGITFLHYFLPILVNLPIFGSTANQYRWNIDVSLSYVGQGMIAGIRIGASMMCGAIIGWGILGPTAVNNNWVERDSDTDEWTNSESAWVILLSLSIMLGESITSLLFTLIRWIYLTVTSSNSDNKTDVDGDKTSRNIKNSTFASHQARYNYVQLPGDETASEMQIQSGSGGLMSLQAFVEKLKSCNVGSRIGSDDPNTNTDIDMDSLDIEYIRGKYIAWMNEISENSQTSKEFSQFTYTNSNRGYSNMNSNSNSLAYESFLILYLRDKQIEYSSIHGTIPKTLWIPGMIISGIICILILNSLTKFQLTWYQVLFSLFLASFVSLLSVRALGETDFNPVDGVGKLSQMAFWGVMNHMGNDVPSSVVNNLTSGGITASAAVQAGDMMQSFKTGYLLTANAKLQFYSQLIGVVCSVLFSVLAFQLFTSIYDIPSNQFEIPSATLWLEMAELLYGGSLPTNVLTYCEIGFILGGILGVLNNFRHLQHLKIENDKLNGGNGNDNGGDVKVYKWLEYVPSGVALGIGMFITPNYVFPNIIGGITQFVWNKYDKRSYDQYMVVVASGFVLGQGITAIVTALMKEFEIPCCFVN